MSVQLCIFSVTLIFGPFLSLPCHRASKSHCAAQHFCLCFRSCDRQWSGRSAARPAVPSELNHEVEQDSSSALQLGRCITGLGNSGVSWSSSMWQHAPGNAVTCTAPMSWHSFASTPTLSHGIWTDTGPMRWFERLKIAKWKSGIWNCSSICKNLQEKNSQMISKSFHTFLILFFHLMLSCRTRHWFSLCFCLFVLFPSLLLRYILCREP